MPISDSFDWFDSFNVEENRKSDNAQTVFDTRVIGGKKQIKRKRENAHKTTFFISSIRHETEPLLSNQIKPCDYLPIETIFFLD